MRFQHHLMVGVALAAGMIAGAAKADPLPMDAPVTLGGVETVCTGVGSAKDDPRWLTYPVRIVFSNGGAQFLSGAHVTLSDGAHKQLSDFVCDGSWVLLKPPAGTYSVSATIGATKPRAATFQPPASGQKVIELQFPDFKPNQ